MNAISVIYTAVDAVVVIGGMAGAVLYCGRSDRRSAQPLKIVMKDE